MGRGNLISERLACKLIANGIIPRKSPVTLISVPSGHSGTPTTWKAVHSVTKAPYGVWSDVQMTELIRPGILVKDSRGRVTRRP